MCFKGSSQKGPNKTSVNSSTTKTSERQDKSETKTQKENPKAQTEKTSSNQVITTLSSSVEPSWSSVALPSTLMMITGEGHVEGFMCFWIPVRNARLFQVDFQMK